MAKDGTNRGGRRVRAGDKPTPLADKITAGKAAKVLEAPDLKPETALAGAMLPVAAALSEWICRSQACTSAPTRRTESRWARTRCS